MNPHIGVIGLGQWGAAMARLLAADGYGVHACDLEPARTAAAATQAGVTGHGSARAVAENSALVLLALPHSQAAAAACLGPDGVLEGAARGLLVVDTSGGHPEHSRQLATELAAGGVRYIDAAITGAAGGAEALAQRALTFCVGGSAADLAQARPILERLARGVFHVGPLGAGQLVKLIDELVSAAAGVAALEGLLIAAKHGVDVKRAAQVLDQGSRMHFLRPHPDLALAPGAAGGPPLGALTQNLRHLSELARRSDVPALVTDPVFHLFELFVREQGAGAELLRQVEVLQKWAGVRLDGTPLD